MRPLLPLMLAATVLPVPAVAQTSARDLLTQASFSDRDPASALRKVQAVMASTDRDASFEGRLLHATALGYRAKLTGSRSDLSGARRLFEAVVASNPSDADGQAALGAWHLATLSKLGALFGRVLGANRAAGNTAFDRAVALGGNHAFYPGLAALFRLKADPADARGRQLAEQATRAGVSTSLDRIMQRAAGAILVPARAGNAPQTKALATRLLPFGSFINDD